MLTLDALIKITTLLYGVFQLVFFVRDNYRISSQSNDGSTDNRTTQSRHTHNLIDLSFSLLFSVLIILLLTNAFISTGKPANPLDTFLYITLPLSIIIPASFFMAWRLGKMALPCGCWSLITIMVISLSSAGPFNASVQEQTQGINLWVPLMALLIISATAWLYILGNPFDKHCAVGNRIKSAVLQLAIIGVVTVTLGKQFENRVNIDERAPKITSNAAKAALETFKRFDNIEKRRDLYAVLSESDLAYQYLKQSQRAESDLSITLSSQVIEPAELSKLQSYSMFDQRKFLARYPNANAAIEERKLTKINQHLARINRVKNISDFYEYTSVENQELYLAERLRWIHATGHNNEPKPTYELPGISTEQRTRMLNNERIIAALQLQPSLSSSLFNEFNYSRNVRKHFDDFKDVGELFTDLIFGSPKYQQFTPSNQSTLFPAIGAQAIASRLLEQLSLPGEYEFYLAMQQYQIIANRHLKATLYSQGMSEEQTQSILDLLASLSTQQHYALRYYLISHKSANKNYAALQATRELDLAPLRARQDNEALKRLRTFLDSPELASGNYSDIKQLAQKIRDLPNADDKINSENLLKYNDPRVPVRHLFATQFTRLISALAQIGETKRKIIFDYIKDPITPALTKIIQGNNIETLSQDENILLNDFARWNSAEKKALLLSLAGSLYSPSSQHSLDFFSLVVSQVGSWSSTWGMIIASLMTLPFVIIFAILSFYLSRKLVSRDRLLSIVAEEAGLSDGKSHALGVISQLQGRSAIINNLLKLAGRGWSAVAIVGRRGVGKTRILYDLYSGKTCKKAISGWVSAPSSFTESEFIQSLLERLTASVEGCVARYLGAEPLEVRRLENKNTQRGIGLLMITALVTAYVFSLIVNRIPDTHILASWFPILVVLILALGTVSIHLIRLQPIDLTPWLERDRSNSPHAVLLYREALKAREFIKNYQTVAYSGHPEKHTPMPGRVITGVFIGFLLVMMTGTLLIFLDNTPKNMFFSLGPLIFLVTGIAAIKWIQSFRKDNAPSPQYSLMSLTSYYRSFAENTVYRIRKGALGEWKKNAYEVIICIDELDKVIKLDEVKALLRKIKSLFEIPGVYYYLSISEDALKRLQFGSIEGKDEIDSAFDHIVRIPALDLTSASNIANSYWAEHSPDTCLPPTAATAIALLSFGISRDIIRICDEVMASEVVAAPGNCATNIIKLMRSKQLNIAISERVLGIEKERLFNGDPMQCINNIRKILNTTTTADQNGVLLSLWLLCVAELASSSDDWNEQAEQLMLLGYRLPIDPHKQIIAELDSL